MVTVSDNALWQLWQEASWGFSVPNDRDGNCDWKEPTDMTLIKNSSIPHERKSTNYSWICQEQMNSILVKYEDWSLDTHYFINENCQFREITCPISLVLPKDQLLNY